MARDLTAGAFPEGTPLNHFLAWNEPRLVQDRRYVVLRDIYYLLDLLGNGDAAVEACVAHLVGAPPITWRRRASKLASISIWSLPAA